MLNANNALGFAIRNKVEGLTQLRSDRNAIIQSFEENHYDNDDYNDSFLLAKRLAGTAMQVYGQCSGFIRQDLKTGVFENGKFIEVKRLRPGKPEDCLVLATIKNQIAVNDGKGIIETTKYIAVNKPETMHYKKVETSLLSVTKVKPVSNKLEITESNGKYIVLNQSFDFKFDAMLHLKKLAAQ